FMSRPLALAEPVPLTLASLMVKSLGFIGLICPWERLCEPRQKDRASQRRSHPGRNRASQRRSHGMRRNRASQRRSYIFGVRQMDGGAEHVPGGGGAALGAESTVHALVFVLHHDAAGLFQRGGDIQRLGLGGARRL